MNEGLCQGFVAGSRVRKGRLNLALDASETSQMFCVTEANQWCNLQSCN